MKIGFGRNDITPRVGVELSGFGAFITRHSVAIRDRLWARAMAVEQGDRRAILVSCDLIGIQRSITRRIRELVTAATGVPAEAVMVHCTHTHSGPNTGGFIGWGAADEPYIEVLPQRVAQACREAMRNLREATLSHAEVPCEGIGQNREYDRDALPLAEVLDDHWRPQKPELTDTTTHVLKAEAAGRTIGFLSYFGCHPVVCCASSRYVHGDYCGVATNLLEREYPGSVGLFLQGAQGDVNTCVVHKDEQESLLALDVIAGRYARAVRRGLAEGHPLKADRLGWAWREIAFQRRNDGIEKLRQRLADQEKITLAPGASDAEGTVRMATVCAIALRRLIEMHGRGQSLAPASEIQGLRLGPVLLLGGPFETFQAIKNDVRARTGNPLTLVMSFTNDYLGYAPDHTAAARGGYAADTVPLIIGALPFAGIHDELVEALVSLAAELR